MKLLSKLFLLLLCMFSLGSDIPNHIAAVLLVCILFTLTELNNRKIRLACHLLFVVSVFVHPDFVSFLPILVYESYAEYDRRSIASLALLVLAGDNSLYLLAVSATAFYLAAFEKNTQRQLAERTKKADDLQERLLAGEEQLNFRNHDMNHQIEIAILSERNRIAREIHDSVGHTLSSCILQTEVLKLQSTDEKQIRQLKTLQETLQHGMRDIRTSLHDLHDSSLNLQKEMEALTRHFPLSVQFVFSANEDMDYGMKVGILSAAKEIFANIAKHSDAQKVTVRFTEHKSYYSLSVKDNGSRPVNSDVPIGIGLRSLEDFAKKYGGYFSYGYESDGFFVHITLQKTAINDPHENLRVQTSESVSD